MIVKPSQILFHGTSMNNRYSIEENGLIPKNYDKVYLTADIQVAYNYAKEKFGNPVICIVDAPQMVKDGFDFEHDSEHAEWKTNVVPPKYLLQVMIEREDDLSKLIHYIHQVS